MRPAAEVQYVTLDGQARRETPRAPARDFDGLPGRIHVEWIHERESIGGHVRSDHPPFASRKDDDLASLGPPGTTAATVDPAYDESTSGDRRRIARARCA